MKTKQLLVALALCLSLAVPAAPVSLAMPERASGELATLSLKDYARPLVAVEPAALALEAPVQGPAAGPTPTPDAPSAPAGEGVEDTAVPQEIAGVPGVTDDWWQKVQEQIRGDLYSFTAEEAEGKAQAYHGYNPDHRFDLTFAAGGVYLAPTSTGAEGGPSREGEPSWTWELRTTGYGYEGDVRPLPAPAETASDGNRLEYRHAGLSEWYVSDERGLEQGFTLDAPPPGDGEVLVLEMALDTGLVPLVATEQAPSGDHRGELVEPSGQAPTLRSGQAPTLRSGQAIEFTQPEGNVVLLRYSDLYAYDALGQSLPARMALSGCGRDARPGSCRLRLVIDAAGALYPLRIDPLLTAPDWAAVGENTGDAFGYSVATAGDVNGDGFADLIVGAYGLYIPPGRAYVYHGSPAGLGYTPAWSASSEAGADYFGFAVATAGDVNGDGYDDIVVGAPRYPYSGPDTGLVYVYHGSPAGLGAAPAWSVGGENAYDAFGSSVATAGDVNGDGFADMVVGAPYNSAAGAAAGKTYLYHGSPAGLVSPAAWTAVGDAGDAFGSSVAAAGDVNGDGFADLAVGAPYNSAGGAAAGKACVYYGDGDGLGQSDREPDWFANGENTSDRFGCSVATAGDVTGDGYDDLAVGAYGYDNSRGKTYVYHGNVSGLGESDRESDWFAVGENVGDFTGYPVATAGDVNDDGFADIVIGAMYNDAGGTNAGKATVYHGSPAGLGASPAWTATGENASDEFGNSVATAGDINGDGYADLVVGAMGYDTYRGKAYVYHGTVWGLNPAYDWTAGGENAYDRFGCTVGTAGDVNGDGYADLVVGAPAYDGGRGKAYLFRGSSSGLSPAFAWTATGESAGDSFARAVGAAGDLNGDGYDDVVIGAPNNGTGGTSAGKAYVYYGSAGGLSPAPAWTATGTYAYDSFGASVATAGDVTGEGYADLVVGATGYPQGAGNGKTYVYYGDSTGLTTGPADWTASGEQASAHFGHAVGTAGDVNGDGCADLIVGAWGQDEQQGKAYVYHGCSPLGLTQDPVWTATGQETHAYFGWSLGTAGDANGDGYADVVIGAWGDASNRGMVYVYYGGSLGLTTGVADWSDAGENADDYFGYAVATAGDVDGDGYADLIVGAQGHATSAGQATLYHGSVAGLEATPTWSASGATSGDRLGSAVGTAGDVNGDGFSDLVAGAWGYDDPAHTNAGRVYVYHGAAPGLGMASAWSAEGEDLNHWFGVSAGTAGDLNGDGYADLAVGEHGYDSDRGKVYVYYGSATGLSATPAFTATGEAIYDHFGVSVATAGDVNGDGYGDLVVGADGKDDSQGKAYVYYGSATGLSATPAFTATGEATYDHFGASVATAGDVNGDGYADLVVGAYGYDDSRGKAYVYYGCAGGLGDSNREADWTSTGEGSSFGHSLATAGDVNGDGYADLVVGASLYDMFRGKAYVYHGSPAGLGSAPAWTDVGEQPGDAFASSLAPAGDVNGDGYADLAIGATWAGDHRGKVYVYHGSPWGLDVPFSVFTGGSEGEGSGETFGNSVATAGDVDGDGYADLAISARGYDVPDNPDTPEDESVLDVGQVYVFHGSLAGLARYAAWRATGENAGDRLGSVVAPAADVNGDGYADLVTSATGYLTSTGKVYVYHGHDNGGRAALATQVRGDISGMPVQPWGPAYTADRFGVSLQAVDPLGRSRARLQVQACPPGVPFGDAACLDQLSDNWIEVSSGGDVELSRIVGGLDEGTLYRWRTRAVYDSPLYSHGPWRRLMGQALEGDVRVTRLAADLSLAKTIDPEEPLATGAPITYTLVFASNGPARGVVITDLLSSDITSVSVISSGAAITDTGHDPCCVWSVQDLEANGGGVITITGVAQVERFVNTAVITGTSPDPDPANNRATVQTHIPGVLFVDGRATGANNGLSWVHAYTDLQDALAEAQPGDQIWIAGGTYRPVASGLRSSSFHLVGGVALHGGFAGSENWLHERDPAAQPTVLSGDIGTLNNPDDNVYHVVTAGSGLTETAVLEGLTISGGNADGNGDNGLGGGLFNQGGSPTLINVSFIGNAAVQGGGLYNAGSSSPALVNVAFSGNDAETEGGGMYNADSSPILANVTFSHNAASQGGGIYSTGDSVITLTNAILWGNSGGQIALDGSSDVTVSHSDVQGGCPAGVTCDQVINKDPQFWNPEGEDGLAGTLDDDLRIYTTFRHPSPVIDWGDNSALPPDTWDLDGDSNKTEPLPRDLSGRWRLIGFKSITATVDMGAYEATIVDVLAQGASLFEQGEAFRLENLQLLSADTLADALKNYANFNDGEWYYAFCGDYGQIDEEGYCPEGDPQAVRNTLLGAVDLYRVAVGWPTEVFTTVRGIEIPVWEGGGQGVLSSTTEIANVHLIFGNEFLVDATDYRFSTAGIPYADQIIAQELDELGQAQRQFELIMELVFRAFNEWGVGDYCSGDQFEQFGVASSLLMSTLNETAARYYMLRQSEAALEVYERAYRDQYLQIVALEQMAEASGSEYLRNGSWEMLNNLSQMRERAQAISQGLDFFGFAPEYVPLQAYEQLLQLVEGPTGDTGLLGTARDLEDQARDAQRTFDANASDMATELDNLTVELDNQLFELCGESDDDYQTCNGGLMEQNFAAMDAASLRMGLAWLRAQNLAEQIQIEADRAGQVIMVHLGLGQDISVAELAIGKLKAEFTQDWDINGSENRFNAGASWGAVGSYDLSYKVGDLGPEHKFGFRTYLEGHVGFDFSIHDVDQSVHIWDPTAEEIAGYESLKALKQAEAQAEIEGANSAAVIRNLLLAQSEALEEFEIAVAEFNQLAVEHNYLAQRRSRLINLRHQAINRVASHNSHLLSPAYRIWRDSLTTQSAGALALAAQFAYLTARAAEYELLTPYPDLGQIFRARTANDIRLFLDGLAVWVQALDRPGQLNRYPYTISLARDIWGLTDQALDPDSILSEEARQQERYEAFQDLLQANVYGNRLEFTFITTLDQQRTEGQYLFSPNIWNNRIAGIGAPLAQNEGIWLNIVTRQGGDVGSPEVVLVHGRSAGGAEAYRNVAGETVYYDPATAVPVGYIIPIELDPANTTAVLRPGINGAGAIANSALVNLSVAATEWTLRIPAESRGDLDYSQIEDIEIVLDTTGRALPGRDAQAEQDALRLQAGLEMEPVQDRLAISAPAPPVTRLAPRLTAPSIPGQIGGSYFGSVVVTSPITLTIQVLNFELWNDGGILTGTVNSSDASLYPDGLSLNGSTPDNHTFQLTSDAFTTTVAGQTVTQVFSLTGQSEDGSDILRGDFDGTITSLLPDPIVVQGRLSASRPGAVGSPRLVLRPAATWVQPGASTAITATLYDEAMAVVTETRTLTFTANLGTVTPPVVQTVDGEAVVTFTADDTEGQATVWATTGEITGSVRIQVSDMAPPQADFSASPIYGTAPLTVTFTDLSLGEPNGWSWDFGDATSSAEQNPSHVYTAIGTYTVTLTASNALDADTLTRPNYIIVAEPMAPEAHFSAEPTSGIAPLMVAFSDESAHYPTGWAWDFGDGGASTERHPEYTYQTAGTFTVTLTVSNTMGSNTLSMPGYITVKEGQRIYLPLVLRGAP